MELLSYILASLIGISLGLIGGGGSILTVPILVYVSHIEPVKSTAYSLFIVGLTALVGAIGKVIKSEVDLKVAILFGIPSIVSVYVTRAFIIPWIPDIISFNEISITKDLLIMLVFGVIMLLASYSMISDKKIKSSNNSKPKYTLILLEGIIVGFITGFVGAGGGFLIIPALVLFLGMEMKIAVGTSLLIIALKSLIGFTGDISNGELIQWDFLLIFSSLSVIGIFIGNFISNYVSGESLKKSFGWFVLVMAIFIISKQIFNF